MVFWAKMKTISTYYHEFYLSSLHCGKTNKSRNENNDPKGVIGIEYLSASFLKASSMCPEGMK
jgi:hypothetical protein